jgi:hypothetical protein
LADKEEIVPPGVALNIGTATHESVHRNLKNKIEKGVPLDREEAKQVARDTFMGLWELGVDLTQDEMQNTLKTQASGVDVSVALSDLHYMEVAPGLQPVATEEKFVVVLKNYPFDLAGTLDVREEYDDISIIWDTKTSGVSLNQGAIESSMQMRTYSLGHRVLHKKLPNTVGLHVLVKNKKPKLIILDHVPTDEWINPLLFRIERFAEFIEMVKKHGEGCLLPASTGPNEWCCTRAYCGYATTCPFWSGR